MPGNHDINWDACEAYFKSCAADEEEPLPPFFPKWKHYQNLLKDFYPETLPPFTVETPWSWFELEELKVVVAGLNSTMSEIHELDESDPLITSGKYGHFGRVGEDQLRWFAERLETYKAQGWLRLGVVHHNFKPDPSGDEENLRDADLLENVLGPQLNLLLHGHKHVSNHSLMNNGVLVLATGSASVTADANPPEVPCQYQMIRIGPELVQRWPRGYVAAQRRWTADPSQSESGDDYKVEHEVRLESVHGTFPGLKATESTWIQKQYLSHLDTDSDGIPDAAELVLGLDPLEGRRFPLLGNRMLDRVVQICKLRNPNANTTIIQGLNPFSGYLLVTIRRCGLHTTISHRRFRVGAHDRSTGKIH